jgi:hypothetical protein
MIQVERFHFRPTIVSSLLLLLLRHEIMKVIVVVVIKSHPSLLSIYYFRTLWVVKSRGTELMGGTGILYR